MHVALSTASLMILLGVVLLNGVAFSLYRQKFFLLIGLGWLVNALYLVLEVPWLAERSPLTEFGGYLISLLTAYAFFFAALVSYRQPPSVVRSNWRPILLVTTAVIAAPVGLRFLAPSDFQLPFGWAVLPGVLFHTAVLTWLSLRIRSLPAKQMLRLLRGRSADLAIRIEDVRAAAPPSPEQRAILSQRVRRPLDSARRLWVAAFGTYAVLQLFYLLKDAHGSSEWFLFLYYLALALKIVVGASLALLLLADRNDVTEAFRIRSVTEELGALTASVEHDIRNPLSNLRKKLATLRREYQADSHLLKGLSFVDQQIDRIRAATDIIPLFRETDEYYEKRRQLWNLVDVCRTAASSVTTAKLQKRPRITVSSTRKVINVQAYRERLIQALVNIINNGVEACLEKDPLAEPVVTILCQLSDDSLRAQVFIVDAGTGIPADIRDIIERPLFSTKSRDQANRGIGLFTASRIIQHHQGALSFESDGESFTRVCVELPLAA